MPLDRAAMIDGVLEDGGCDVLVVGGGINGAATFRDLALQGLRCVIVDREDFGAGASSASTRMAHGGLRYLENGEVRLVAEATRERNLLLRNAAHYVEPLPVVIPSFSLFGGVAPSLAKLVGRAAAPPASRGLALVEAGLQAYDFLGRRSRVTPRHATRLARATRRRFPALHPGIRGAACYHDATISHAERVAFELVADGLAASPGSRALNHCELEGRDGAVVVLRDRQEGAGLLVHPRLMVNATGAWIDGINRRLGRATALIGGTKGSHLVLDCPELREAMAGCAFSFDDGRGRMCITYAFGDKVLLGSTDIRVANPDEARCDADEVRYLLGAIRIVFPTIDVRPDQIRYRFCGVRPLPRSKAGNTVDISRDHAIEALPPAADVPFPVLSLVGGKWTTFRAFAEQAANRVLAELGRVRRVGTRDLPIGGGHGFPREPAAREAWVSDLAGETGLARERVADLFRRYGTAARDVALVCAVAPDYPVPDLPCLSEREVGYQVERELVASAADVVFRRTTLAMEGRLTFNAVERIAWLVAAARGRPDEADADLAATLRRLEQDHGVDLRASPATAAARRPALAPP